MYIKKVLKPIHCQESYILEMKWGYVESPFQVISNFCLEFENKEILNFLLLISN